MSLVLFVVQLWTNLPIPFRMTSLALRQPWHYHSASEAILQNMGKINHMNRYWLLTGYLLHNNNITPYLRDITVGLPYWGLLSIKCVVSDLCWSMGNKVDHEKKYDIMLLILLLQLAGPEYFGKIRSISWLLTIWLLALLGHLHDGELLYLPNGHTTQ